MNCMQQSTCYALATSSAVVIGTGIVKVIALVNYGDSELDFINRLIRRFKIDICIYARATDGFRSVENTCQ